jgi:hypothetical protein
MAKGKNDSVQFNGKNLSEKDTFLKPVYARGWIVH